MLRHRLEWPVVSLAKPLKHQPFLVSPKLWPVTTVTLIIKIIEFSASVLLYISSGNSQINDLAHHAEILYRRFDMLFRHITCHVLKRSHTHYVQYKHPCASKLWAYWHRSFWTLLRQLYWVTRAWVNKFRDTRRVRVLHVRCFNWNESITKAAWLFEQSLRECFLSIIQMVLVKIDNSMNN